MGEVRIYQRRSQQPLPREPGRVQGSAINDRWRRMAPRRCREIPSVPDILRARRPVRCAARGGAGPPTGEGPREQRHLFDRVEANTPMSNLCFSDQMSEDERQRSLGLLTRFNDACERRGVDYSLCFGTALELSGGGFIPWDDDMDVCVPARDEPALREVLRDINGMRCSTYGTAPSSSMG